MNWIKLSDQWPEEGEDVLISDGEVVACGNWFACGGRRHWGTPNFVHSFDAYLEMVEDGRMIAYWAKLPSPPTQ